MYWKIEIMEVIHKCIRIGDRKKKENRRKHCIVHPTVYLASLWTTLGTKTTQRKPDLVGWENIPIAVIWTTKAMCEKFVRPMYCILYRTQSLCSFIHLAWLYLPVYLLSHLCGLYWGREFLTCLCILEPLF